MKEDQYEQAKSRFAQLRGFEARIREVEQADASFLIYASEMTAADYKAFRVSYVNHLRTQVAAIKKAIDEI